MIGAVAAFSGGVWVQNRLNDIPVPKISRAIDESASFKLSVKVLSASIPGLADPGLLTRERPSVEVVLGHVRKETEFGDFKPDGNYSKITEGAEEDTQLCPWSFGDTLTFSVRKTDLFGPGLQVWVRTQKDVRFGTLQVSMSRPADVGMCSIDFRSRLLPACMQKRQGTAGETAIWESGPCLMPLTHVSGANAAYRLGDFAGHLAIQFSTTENPADLLKFCDDMTQPLVNRVTNPLKEWASSAAMATAQTTQQWAIATADIVNGCRPDERGEGGIYQFDTCCGPNEREHLRKSADQLCGPMLVAPFNNMINNMNMQALTNGENGSPVEWLQQMRAPAGQLLRTHTVLASTMFGEDGTPRVGPTGSFSAGPTGSLTSLNPTGSIGSLATSPVARAQMPARSSACSMLSSQQIEETRGGSLLVDRPHSHDGITPVGRATGFTFPGDDSAEKTLPPAKIEAGAAPVTATKLPISPTGSVQSPTGVTIPYAQPMKQQAPVAQVAKPQPPVATKMVGQQVQYVQYAQRPGLQTQPSFTVQQPVVPTQGSFQGAQRQALPTRQSFQAPIQNVQALPARQSFQVVYRNPGVQPQGTSFRVA